MENKSSHTQNSIFARKWKSRSHLRGSHGLVYCSIFRNVLDLKIPKALESILQF